jgi:hypothetical protein
MMLKWFSKGFRSLETYPVVTLTSVFKLKSDAEHFKRISRQVEALFETQKSKGRKSRGTIP